MASIEFLKKRIAGKEKQIDGLAKKIARIEEAKATGWEKNPYLYTDDDLKWAYHDIEEARSGLAKYQQQLNNERNKAASRNVPAILEFLERWKVRVLEYYGKDLKAAYDEKAEIQKLTREGYANQSLQAELRKRQKEFRQKLRGVYEKQTFEWRGRPRTEEVKVKEGEWEHIVPYMKGSYEESMEFLRRQVDQEAIRKYDFIIQRTTSIVGTITDATGLKLGAKDDLNGYIIGTEGRVSVKTIGAGGYNIQCFHFRTLIKKA